MSAKKLERKASQLRVRASGERELDKRLDKQIDKRIALDHAVAAYASALAAWHNAIDEHDRAVMDGVDDTDLCDRYNAAREMCRAAERALLIAALIVSGWNREKAEESV